MLQGMDHGHASNPPPEGQHVAAINDSRFTTKHVGVMPAAHMAGHTVIDAILFEHDSTSLELQWVYDQDDDPDIVFREVLSEIKKATGVGSEEQFQIKTKPKSRIISLRTCLEKVLQGKAEKISVIVDQQLQLQLVLLCKPAGKGRITGELAMPAASSHSRLD
jgi:hypothetical protein